MLAKITLLAWLSVGINSCEIQNRIVGGVEPQVDSVPYIVSIDLGVYNFRISICGGSIITSTWIVTAGHCVTNEQLAMNLWVRAGIHNILENGQLEKVIQIVVHPYYIGMANPNDIAVLKLQNELIFGSMVAPIRLPARDSIPTGVATLSGWGSISTTRTPSYVQCLQTVDLLLISNQECVQTLHALEGSRKGGTLSDTGICTGALYQPISGGCVGDSGGPLVIEENGEPVLVGIVSWGYVPCGQIGTPTVYTRVSAFLDFIYAHVLWAYQNYQGCQNI